MVRRPIHYRIYRIKLIKNQLQIITLMIIITGWRGELPRMDNRCRGQFAEQFQIEAESWNALQMKLQLCVKQSAWRLELHCIALHCWLAVDCLLRVTAVITQCFSRFVNPKLSGTLTTFNSALLDSFPRRTMLLLLLVEPCTALDKWEAIIVVSWSNYFSLPFPPRSSGIAVAVLRRVQHSHVAMSDETIWQFNYRSIH